MDYYIWAIAGHELDTLSIRVHNSLAVHDNFNNFSEFQNDISDRPPPPTTSVIMTHCVQKSTCDSPLT